MDASKWKSKSKCRRIRETNWKFLRSQFALRDRLHSISWKFLQGPGMHGWNEDASFPPRSDDDSTRVFPKHRDPSCPVEKFSPALDGKWRQRVPCWVFVEAETGGCATGRKDELFFLWIFTTTRGEIFNLASLQLLIKNSYERVHLRVNFQKFLIRG